MGDRITFWFLAAIALIGIIYISFDWTPSSYGIVLDHLHAPQSGPVFGSSRDIRSDEFAVATPFFQAAVRNRFQRINQTSFYHDDMRTNLALPLEDWSLLFKPQMWAFFLIPPAKAYAIYWTLLMCAFLAGFHLLFLQLGVPAWLAAASTVILYFTGFNQFWWTTFAPSLAGLPWILLTILRPGQSWKKAILCAWLFPAVVLSHINPPVQLTLAWCGVIVILAFRPRLLRSPGDLSAIAAGAIASAVVVYAYYGDIIPLIRNTVYPGRRISPPGGAPAAAVFSEIFPFLSFRLSDYQNFTGENICEIGAVGSFLPLLTLCLTRYRSLLAQVQVRNRLLVLLGGFTAITLWEVAPVPAWIGRLLQWDTADAQRWLFTSGFLLTLACLLVWSNKLISPHPLRITLFVLIGPVAGLLIKLAWQIDDGHPAHAVLSESLADYLLCGLGLAAGVAAWYIPAVARAPVLVTTIALMNMLAFGGFNPVQSAGPIFQVPETDVVRDLRKQAAASPDGVLLNSQFFGSTLNGLGFRSVAHTVAIPQLAFFRQYFPFMDREAFDRIFNRYAHIILTADPLPDSPYKDVIKIPMEVFVPVRNVRHLAFGAAQRGACARQPAGGIGNISAQGATLTVEGWAPWSSETDAQGIRVLSSRALRFESLSTGIRPDIAEQLRDYRSVKSGFKLRISSVDGRPLRREGLAFLAFGTLLGEVRLACCACP